MKKITPLFFAILLLISCKSSHKQLSSGNYDAAIRQSAKKIKKSPGKFEEVDTFNEAYQMAYNRDYAGVNRLKKEGNPANWSKIYYLYLKMKQHQDIAASLPPVGINYVERDFTKDISIAKNKAIEYAYAKGEQLLAKNDRFEARKAYGKYKEVQNYNPTYKDVKEKIAIAQLLGTTNVLVIIEDNAQVILPKAMKNEMQAINVDDLDKKWTNYDSYIDTTILYHYTVILNLKLIDASPEQVANNSTTESKEIEDGFHYLLDSKGNVTKDSLGNDIKIPTYKTIVCKVTRFHQKKTARVAGDIEYYDNVKKKSLKKEPIASDALFENHYTLTYGNINALSYETRRELDASRPLPFPKDELLIIQAADIIKNMTKDIIVQDKSFFK